jgi:folate-binding protein YgfZ
MLTFLQGQLSQDVDMPVGQSRWSLLLAPTGKVEAWLRVTRSGDDEMVLDTDAGFGEAIITRLERFKLRTKCELELSHQRCVAVRGVELDVPSARPIVWPGTTGCDVFDDEVDLGDVPLTADYERARIEAGVPAMGRELTEATIPVEAGQWLIDASVSFTKGCYTGQELVARIDSRGGNAPRPVRGLRLSVATAVGAHIASADGKELGTVTSAEGTVALAPLPRSVVPPADVVVDGQPAQVVELPMR